MYKYKELYGQLSFTEIPDRTTLMAQGLELTQISLDKTKIMKLFFPDPAELLGEIQFSFVVFMLGQNLEALEQWKALLCLVSTCREAI